MTGFIQLSGRIVALLLLPLVVLASWPFLRERPEFQDLPDALVSIHFERAAHGAPEGWTLHGAWELETDDPRLAGMSGLTCPAHTLEIVTDTGSRLTMPFPDADADRVTARIAGLPGIGDAEAIAIVGVDTIVAEEIRHRLWTFSEGQQPRSRLLPASDGVKNWGVEALLEPAASGDDLLAFLEMGDRAYRVGASVEIVAIDNPGMRITGAARRPDGKPFVLMRRLGPLGFSAALAAVETDGEAIRLGEPMALPMPFNANAEGLCVEPREEGLTRLWIVTDDNGLEALSQRLVAWDVPDAAWPKAPGTELRAP